MRSRDKSRQESGAAWGNKETGIWITWKKTAGAQNRTEWHNPVEEYSEYDGRTGNVRE
ncbi:MAG: hypothetical protein ACLR6I_20260 [Waltera sp.]